MPETLRGWVCRAFHASPSFSAGVLETEDGRRVRFAGRGFAPQGEHVVLTGRWHEDPKYGRQFVADFVTYEPPVTCEGLVQFLARHPRFTGVGEVTARKIVDYAGSVERLDALLRDPSDEPRRAMRLPHATWQSLREAWQATHEDRAVRTFLAGFDLTHHQTETLLARFGPSILGILKHDPYVLIKEVKNFGFKKVDKIARAMGVPKNHPGRIEAGLLYVVGEETGGGHTYVGGADLVNVANDLLVLDTLDSHNIIRAAGQRLLTAGHLVHEGPVVTTPELYAAEQFVHLTFDVHRDGAATPVDVAPFEVGLRARQVEALRTAARQRITTISGGAGTGKTFVLARLVQAFERAGLRMALCAPTGKAAKRIEESLRAQGLDLDAKTIHRMLEYDGHEFHRENLSPPNEGGERPGDDESFDTVIVDECFDYKQPILTQEGWQYIGPLVNNRRNTRVWSRNPSSGELELKPVIRWLRHPAPSMLLKITAGRSESFRSARVIRCTPEHRILTPYGYRLAGDLKVGEEVTARGYCLTSEQKSIVVGSLLGDAGLNRDSKRSSPQVVFVQGEAQLAYLEFKRQAFGPLAGVLKNGKSGYGDKAVWRFLLKVTDDTQEIAHETIVTGRHPSGRKRWSPTDRFLQWIDEQALAIWYLDNGSINTRTNADGTVSHFAKIHSQRFDHETHLRLVGHLRTAFGLEAKVKNDSKGFLHLCFNKQATGRLMELVSPFTPAVMAYKVTGEARYEYVPTPQPETCTARIQSIEQVAPSTDYVYDLEVADHHNYVAGNIIVSNCSMVDVPLMAELLRRIDFSRTRLILVGDHNQLPAVGPGNVLRDIIAHNLVPTVILDEVVRQAGVLKANSAAILQSTLAPSAPNNPSWVVIDQFRDTLPIQTYVRDLVLQRIPKHLHLDPIRDVQIITPTHRGDLGTKALNEMMQRLFHRSVNRKFMPGDKVIQTYNAYDLGVMNGTLGRVLSYEQREGVHGYWIDFEGTGQRFIAGDDVANVQLAYALTAHRAQGSEFPCAVVVCHKSHYFADRNWLYTAVTRAARYCFIVGDRWGLRHVVRKTNNSQRRTLLGRWAMDGKTPP